MSKLNTLKKRLNIDDRLTKTIKKDKKKTKISDVMTLLPQFNYMADILYLPSTKYRYKYLLVVVDLATHEFDIEPMRTKTATSTLTAFQKMFQRNFISKPKVSLRTDNGKEFQGVFHKYLKDNKIFHSVSMPYRHSQMSMVESLNRTLGLLFNGYMNKKERETGRVYKQWTDVLDVVRTELNKIRKKQAPYTEKTIFLHKDTPVNLSKPPKYKVGQAVHYKLSFPETALGKKQPTANFRTGDYRWSAGTKKIKKILYYSGQIPYRYMLDGMPYVSFTENELLPTTM
jgi:hypothetical protein